MEVVIGLIILSLLFGGSGMGRVKCRVCIWRGSEKLWNDNKGCPNCRTDEKPKVI